MPFRADGTKSYICKKGNTDACEEFFWNKYNSTVLKLQCISGSPQEPAKNLDSLCSDGHCQCAQESAWVLSQPESPGSAHSTPQLSARSGADASWEKFATEAAQIPGGSTATSVPAATTPRPPAPGYSTPQPCTRSGTNTTEKGL